MNGSSVIGVLGKVTRPDRWCDFGVALGYAGDEIRDSGLTSLRPSDRLVRFHKE